MRDQLNEYFENGELPKVEQDKDPFWDPSEPMLVGTSYLSLKNLGYMLNNDLNAKILSSEGERGMRGMVMVKYWPCAANGTDEPDDDLMCDEPHELVGKECYFNVEIEFATDLPAELCKNVFVQYSLKHEPGVIFRTDECPGLN